LVFNDSSFGIHAIISPFHFQVTVEVYFKAENAQNFFPFIKLQRIDACFIMNNPWHFNWDLFEACHQLTPALCHKCPFLPGDMSFNIWPHDDDYRFCPRKNERQNGAMFVMDNKNWPDGDYRFFTGLSSEVDVEGFWVNYFFKVKNGNKNSF
jgi:hypothetical protein